MRILNPSRNRCRSFGRLLLHNLRLQSLSSGRLLSSDLPDQGLLIKQYFWIPVLNLLFTVLWIATVQKDALFELSVHDFELVFFGDVFFKD